MIAFSKIDSYAWQDEFRYVFSITDALKYGSTQQTIVIPNQPPGTAVPPPSPEPRNYFIKDKIAGKHLQAAHLLVILAHWGPIGAFQGMALFD